MQGRDGRQAGRKLRDGAEPAESVAYIADLLAELRDIAVRSGHGQLANAIGLAHVEALRQLEQYRADNR